MCCNIVQVALRTSTYVIPVLSLSETMGLSVAYVHKKPERAQSIGRYIELGIPKTF
jgi:hypothetical protein